MNQQRPPVNPTSANPISIDCPTIVAGVKGGVCLSPDGQLDILNRDYLSLKVSEFTIVSQPVLVCHAPTVASRLLLDTITALDILELWAFVRPAQFCVPTVGGLCRELSLPAPDSLEDTAVKTRQIADILLGELRDLKNRQGAGENFANICRMTATMSKAGWGWSKYIMGALGITIGAYKDAPLTAGLDVWNRLPEWEELPPTDTPAHTPISADDAGNRLLALLGDNTVQGIAEIRQGQMDYARGLATAFQAGTPLSHNDTVNDGDTGFANDNGGLESMTPHKVVPPLILAEAGTGVGKTLGYIAPASVWTENNDAPVWISTYTRNLQHQIDNELDKLYPNPQEKYKRVVVRKGRENYVCLGRFEWAVRRGTINPQSLIPLGLLARWLDHTRDGDLNGGDFPSWLTDLVDPKNQIFYNLVVRYDDGGSHADCNHNKKCFVDMVVKRSTTADLVVVNHALVLSQSKLGSLSGTGQGTGEQPDDDESPIPHIIFDEGHHLFAATDSAYTMALTAKEGERLRNFIAPKETDFFDSPDSNLKQLIGDAIADDSDGVQALDDLIKGTHFLVQDGWYKRLENGNPKGTMEWFLYHVGRVVYSRDENRGGAYSLECETVDIPQDMLQAGMRYLDDLRHVERPALQLATSLEMKLANDAHLDTHVRRSLRQAANQLRTRVVGPLLCWRTMMADLMGETEISENSQSPNTESSNTESPNTMVDRFVVLRSRGRDFDVGMVRSLVDPMHYFSTGVVQQSRGVAITSATLTDGRGYEDEHWHWALQRTGANHHPLPATRLRVPSPFDYPKQTRIYIIDDVETRNSTEVAGAFRALFSASNGGALGLFTAIERLHKVYETIAPVMEDIDIPLYAQHVDKLSLPTLLDIFRAEKNSCLLGTDAVRDGVDVPGDSLRMIVFEKVPWTRPDILHKARRKHFGTGYDDALVSARLKQAFGRLIRRQNDRGVFVMLQPLPSRFHDAFPEGVDVVKQGLSQTLKDITEFLQTEPH